MDELNKAIRQYDIGDTIEITIQREIDDVFKPRIIEITIGDKYEYN